MDSYNSARYYFEHSVFRDCFYEADTGEEIIRALLKEGSSFLWDAMLLWCKETGNEIWGTKEQYRVFACKCDNEYSMIRIDMPKPQEELLCYQIYLVFGCDFRRRGYFTVERGASQKVRYLCSWELGESERHCNYG